MTCPVGCVCLLTLNSCFYTMLVWHVYFSLLLYPLNLHSLSFTPYRFLPVGTSSLLEVPGVKVSVSIRGASVPFAHKPTLVKVFNPWVSSLSYRYTSCFIPIILPQKASPT